MKKVIYIIAVLVLLITIYLYNSLPSEIPIHWNVKGEIDGYGPKYFIFISALLPFLIMGGMNFFRKIDPKRENYDIYTKTFDIIKYSLATLFIVLQIVILIAALEYNIDTSLIIVSSVGILFIVLGNYMARIKQNFFVGIKTPWTLSSEKVWNKTHRVGGYVFILMGVMAIITGLLKTTLSIAIFLIATIGGVIFTLVYSYYEYKKEEK